MVSKCYVEVPHVRTVHGFGMMFFYPTFAFNRSVSRLSALRSSGLRWLLMNVLDKPLFSEPKSSHDSVSGGFPHEYVALDRGGTGSEPASGAGCQVHVEHNIRKTE